MIVRHDVRIFLCSSNSESAGAGAIMIFGNSLNSCILKFLLLKVGFRDR